MTFVSAFSVSNGRIVLMMLFVLTAAFMFARSDDATGLAAERNVLRYRPVPVVVRLGERGSVAALLRVVGAGLVWDDSQRWSSWTYAQEKGPRGMYGVRIELEITEGIG